jgi:hypothetical protein
VATRHYLTGAASPYTPTTRRGTWNVASGEDLQLLGRKPQGSVGTSTINVGSTAANRTVLLHRSISAGATKAGTISGTISWVIGVKESATGLNGFWRLHVYVTSGDSDTPRGTLLSNFTGATTFTTTATGATEGAQTVTSVAVQVGDRIVAEIGYSASATSTTQNATINYGQIGTTDLAAAATSVTTDPGWIELSGADGLFTPSFSTLVDGFTSTIDSKWTKTAGVSASGGRAVIPCTSTLNTLYTATAYEIQGSQIAFQVPVVPSGGTGAVFSAYIGPGPTLTNTNLEFEFTVSTGNLVLRNNVAGVDGSPTTLTYSAVDHQWWRVRESAGVIYMETSPDGSTWTTRRTISTPSQWMRTGTLIAHFEAQNSSGTSASAQIDNVNIAGAISIPFGTATETNTAVTLTGRKTGAFGTAAETDSAPTLAGSKRATLGTATEADTARALTGTKTRTFGTATETNTAVQPTGSKRGQYGTALETDTTQALTGSKRGTLGTATETDTAITAAAAKHSQFGTATETDTPVPVTGSKRGAFGTALETDTAHKPTTTPTSPDLGHIRTGPAPTRWTTATSTPRWTTGPGRSSSMDRDSTELLPLPIYTDTDPTSSPVRIAILPPGQRPTAGDWHTATWTTIDGTPHAQIMVGPDGGAITLNAGTWQPWIDITATPEHPLIEGICISIT